MYQGQLHGHLGDYAMTFSMNNDDNRGFLFRHTGMTSSQGAMSLSTSGKMNVAYGIRVGYGISDTTANSSAYRILVSGSIYATSNIVAFSDRRAKENIVPIENGLDIVLAMQGVRYNMIKGAVPDEEQHLKRVGVIAQEVKEVLPEVVRYDEDTGHYAVDYGNITSVLIEAIKDQQEIINSLKERVDVLESR